MFEQEIEMEKQQSSAVPLLLIVALTLVILGFATYYVIEARRVVTTPEAANVIIDVLKAQGPTTVSFHTGSVKEQSDESVNDPRYKLLKKLGVIDIGKTKNYKTPVTLTPKGKELLAEIQGVKQSDEDGVESYVVPLADRRLADVTNITMTSTGHGAVQFTWQWEPNALGEGFDAANETLGAFTSWERATLIDKHGVRFYHEAPTKGVIAVVRTPQGWQIATE